MAFRAINLGLGLLPRQAVLAAAAWAIAEILLGFSSQNGLWFLAPIGRWYQMLYASGSKSMPVCIANQACGDLFCLVDSAAQGQSRRPVGCAASKNNCWRFCGKTGLARRHRLSR